MKRIVVAGALILLASACMEPEGTDGSGDAAIPEGDADEASTPDSDAGTDAGVGGSSGFDVDTDFPGDGADAGGGDPGEPTDPTGPTDATDPTGPEPEPPEGEPVDMTWTTVNIGRDYGTRAEVRAVIDRVGDVIGPKQGPKFLGWQEIGEGDPCGGTCEIEEIRGRFAADDAWDTVRPNGQLPGGGEERVKVPVTSKGANANRTSRAVFASPGWAGVSPTRFVTVVHDPSHNLSVLNTHFIAGAWSCRSEPAKRRDYWRRAWRVLKEEVAREHDLGRNVIVTGDLNRPRGENDCNPAWDPTSLHPSARVVGGASIDYIFAVPAAGMLFTVSKRADGTAKRGDITLGIDGHKAHWVTGSFHAP